MWIVVFVVFHLVIFNMIISSNEANCNIYVVCVNLFKAFVMQSNHYDNLKLSLWKCSNTYQSATNSCVECFLIDVSYLTRVIQRNHTPCILHNIPMTEVFTTWHDLHYYPMNQIIGKDSCAHTHTICFILTRLVDKASNFSNEF